MFTKAIKNYQFKPTKQDRIFVEDCLLELQSSQAGFQVLAKDFAQFSVIEFQYLFIDLKSFLQLSLQPGQFYFMKDILSFSNSYMAISLKLDQLAIRHFSYLAHVINHRATLFENWVQEQLFVIESDTSTAAIGLS